MSETKLVIDLQNKTNYKFIDKQEIEETILKVLNEKKVKGNIEIGVEICSKDEIKELNKKFRQLDAPTDVLSFPIWDKVPKENPELTLIGDIAICPEIVNENAKEYGNTEKDEFIKMLAHGTLHLLGYHHKE